MEKPYKLNKCKDGDESRETLNLESLWQLLKQRYSYSEDPSLLSRCTERPRRTFTAEASVGAYASPRYKTRIHENEDIFTDLINSSHPVGIIYLDDEALSLLRACLEFEKHSAIFINITSKIKTKL